jgi:hypothetical protein
MSDRPRPRVKVTTYEDPSDRAAIGLVVLESNGRRIHKSDPWPYGNHAAAFQDALEWAKLEGFDVSDAGR